MVSDQQSAVSSQREENRASLDKRQTGDGCRIRWLMTSKRPMAALCLATHVAKPADADLMSARLVAASTRGDLMYIEPF